MDAFKGITFEDLVKKYEKNELEMVRDLMKAGLLNPMPEECHGPMHIHGSDPWHWRCPKRECSSKKSVVKGSFLEGKRKYLNVVKAHCTSGPRAWPQRTSRRRPKWDT